MQLSLPLTFDSSFLGTPERREGRIDVANRGTKTKRVKYITEIHLREIGISWPLAPDRILGKLAGHRRNRESKRRLHFECLNLGGKGFGVREKDVLRSFLGPSKVQRGLRNRWVHGERINQFERTTGGKGKFTIQGHVRGKF